jgi:deoxyribonuclease-4
MEIKIGPSGLGPIKDAINNLEEYSKLGLTACEIAFTYGVYIKQDEDFAKIKAAAIKNNIKLSIHGHYFINLNSKEKVKVEASKKRILDCCLAGHKLGATNIVFHPGFYAGMDKKITYENIKKQMIELQKIIKEKKWNVKLCPETTGKINVFGSIEEISNLVKDTKCSFTIDFAHILAREKYVDYDKIKKAFPSKNWHCHFSGIIYGEKGEQKHKKTDKKEWENLLKNLPKNKNITIINESPYTIEDAVMGNKLANK